MYRLAIGLALFLAVLLLGLGCSSDPNALSGIWTGAVTTDKRTVAVEFRFRNDGRLEVVQTDDDGVARTQIGGYEITKDKIVFTPDRIKVSNLTPEQNEDLSQGVQKQNRSLTYNLKRISAQEISITLAESEGPENKPITLKRKTD